MGINLLNVQEAYCPRCKVKGTLHETGNTKLTPLHSYWYKCSICKTEVNLEYLVRGT